MTQLLILPPADAGVLEIVRDYTRQLEIGLFTNQLPIDRVPQLSDYQEPTFPGYWRKKFLTWIEKNRSPDGLAVRKEARVTWQLLTDVLPVDIRGWFATIRLENDEVRMVCEYNPGSIVTVSRRGDTVVAPITLTAVRREV